MRLHSSSLSPLPNFDKDLLISLKFFRKLLDDIVIPTIHSVNADGSSLNHGKALETKCVPSPIRPT